MQPHIQYVQTKDSVSIAFYTLGEGLPLVVMPSPPFNHIGLDFQWLPYRRTLEWVAKKGMLVRYDPRGCGLSDRDVTDISLDSYLLDLEAVVGRLDLEQFILMGMTQSGPVAVAYAVRHPERVSHLILNTTYARGSDVYKSPQAQAFRALRDQDWNIYTETIAHSFSGWSSGEVAAEQAEYLRKCVTQEGARATWAAVEAFDVTELLSQVRSPTLVLYFRTSPWVDLELSRRVASGILGARFVVVEPTPGVPSYMDVQPVARVIEEYIFGGAEPATEAEEAEPGAFRTVLFTDVEGSTALTQRLGDAKARDLLREHERMVREALKAHGGSELKTTGDGFMASFSSATKALECSIAMQRAFAAHNESAEEPILVRVGMNAGEPIAEDEDLFGTAVIEAARIAAAAKGGEILVSDVVRQLAKGKDFLFADRGEVALKGFEDAVRLHEVRWRQ